MPDFEEECLEVEELLINRSEAGVFGVDGVVSASSVADRIHQARTHANANRMPAARRALSLAVFDIQSATRSRGRWWAFRKLHGGLIWCYYLVLLFVLCLLGYSNELQLQSACVAWLTASSWAIPIHAAAYGMLGGILRGLYWLAHKVERSSFRRQFIAPYLGAPWLAGVMGLASYVILKAGVAALGGQVTAHHNEVNFTYAVAAFLAGFSWEWFMHWLKKAQERL